MYEKPFLPNASFPKNNLHLGKATSWFYSALKGVIIKLIQIMRIDMIDTNVALNYPSPFGF